MAELDEVETDRFYLQKTEVPGDSDDEYQYEEVPVDEEFVHSEPDDDLELAVRTIRDGKEDEEATTRREAPPKASVIQKPEVVDDFVRNFLVRMGLQRTLDCFQTEWYELQQRGLLNEEDVGVVPDVYSRNQLLHQDLQYLHHELNKFKDAAMKAKDKYVQLRKERDYHRMHHKRVVQEKNQLVTNIKKLRRHYQSYEPTLQTLKTKYEVAMKEKMLSQLERDRAMGQVTGLQSTLKTVETIKGTPAVHHPGNLSAPQTRLIRGVVLDEDGCGPTQKTLAQERERFTQIKDVKQLPPSYERHPDDSEFPLDRGVNPYLGQVKATSGHLTRTGGFRLSNTIQAHSLSVSGLALHPRKQILATVSDDNTWKMWAVPSGEVIMTGEGHTAWLSSCDFHPSGSRLATTSGDTTVKIWDFSKSECVHTFSDHTLAVWNCSWHSCGDFLATCSMDKTGKIWDLNSLRCRFTLRGHTEAVNSIQFLPFSNIILSSSADKTLSLWDARTGLCAQSFYGHIHSVNHAQFNMRGDTVASCDSYGNVKLWDVRTGAPMVSFDVGPHPANKVAFDPTGVIVAVASNDRTVKMYEVANGQVLSMVGHEDAVQCLMFDHGGEFLVTGGSDATVRIWS